MGMRFFLRRFPEWWSMRRPAKGTPHAIRDSGYGYSLKYADGTNGRDDTFKALQFSPKSRLLIVRGCPEDENCGAYYYEWTGSRFRLLRKFEATPIP